MSDFYGKWDSPETNLTAFECVKSGIWSFERFAAWVNRVEIEEFRNATADESI